MKKMLFLAICFLGMNLASFAQKESDKTLVKTLDPTGATAIAFLFKNAGINAVATPNLNMRVELEIHANMDENTLQKLIAAGRYTLEGKMEDGGFNIYAPNLERRVTVGGTDLEEQVHISVKMPPNYLFDKEKGIIVRDVTDFVQRGESEAKVAQMRVFSELKFDQVQIKLVQLKKPAKKSSSTNSKSKDKSDKSTSTATPNAKTNNGGGKDSKHGDILIDNIPIEGY